MALNKFAAATAVAAAFSLLATPAAAVELPAPAHAKVYDGESGNVERSRRWRRDRGIDAGDVIAGVVILGAIAAVADAAQARRDDRRYPERRYPYPDDARYRSGDERFGSRGMDRAVDMCVTEVERDGERVGSVDAANRDAQGWYVGGTVEDGATYSCRIDNAGRVTDVRVEGAFGGYGYGEAPAERVDDTQYDEEVYARARQGREYGGVDDYSYDGRYEPDDFE